jgi:hypothetical protein
MGDLFGGGEESLNTGVAIVTPIYEVLPLLEREAFAYQRAEIDAPFEAKELLEEYRDATSEDGRNSALQRYQALMTKFPKLDPDSQS